MNNTRFVIDNDEEQSIDLIKWLNILLSNWIIIVTCILVAFFIAFIINKTAMPKYEVASTILVKESINPLDRFQEASPLSVGYVAENQLNNEIGILTSNSLITRTLIKQEDWLSYKCQKKGLFQQVNFHCPFTIEFDKYHPQLAGVEFVLEFLSDSIFTLTSEADKFIVYDYEDYKGNLIQTEFALQEKKVLGEIITGDNFQFSVIPNTSIDFSIVKDYKYSFKFQTLNSLKSKFQTFSVENSRNSSILMLKHRTKNPEKSSIFLNYLLQEYLAKGIERENQIAINTIDFIDNQLVSITDSLSSSENQLESFRQQNKLLNVDFQAEQAFEKMDELQNEKNQLIVKQSYIDYLQKSLRAESEIDNLILPSTLNITDPVLNNLVQELVGLLKDYSESSVNSLKNNPYISSLEQKITYTKNKLLETIENISGITVLSMENNQKRINEVEILINKLPQDQRRLLNIERKFQLNDELYTFLLTKRSEMQIMKASNLPENEILDAASAKEAIQVFPNKRMNYILALFAGFAIPVALLWMYYSFNQKIRTIDDLQEITDYPVIANVFNDFMPGELAKKQNSPIRESLRTLRANLQFSIHEEESNIIMITSAIPSEGKSYISKNLAYVYSQFGKKVCLADFDLRKGKLSSGFGLKKEEGLSTYLSNRNELNEILCNTDEGFSVLPAGSIPPNPGVLIASDKTKELFHELKKEFDIVIIDTPPIGVVSDALFLSSIVDQILFVSRYNISPKSLLTHVFQELKKKKVRNLGIIFNALPNKKRSYGYSYGYGYGYGYFDDKSQRKYSKIFSKTSLFKRRDRIA